MKRGKREEGKGKRKGEDGGGRREEKSAPDTTSPPKPSSRKKGGGGDAAASPPPSPPGKAPRTKPSASTKTSDEVERSLKLPSNPPAAPILSSEAIVQQPVAPQVVERAFAAAERRVFQPQPDRVGELLAGEHTDPHSILGAHPTTVGDRPGIVIRSMMPAAVRCECLLDDGRVVEMSREAEGLVNVFSTFIQGMSVAPRYRFRFHFTDGTSWERGDPYRFGPTVGDIDLHLFNEGTHRKLWTILGAHMRTIGGTRGVSFALWAPNARRVSVLGDFCGWDGRVFPMRMMGSSGVYEIFIPDIHEGALYKFELLTREGMIRLKTDPFAFKMEQYPGTASIVIDAKRHEWHDNDWMSRRAGHEWVREPISIYEAHLGSWARVPEEGNRSLTYREIAPKLADHVAGLGYTHVELMPVSEHPFYGSWGYQVSGYYAASSRYGNPEDFKFLVDTLHQRGIGVILDWVPAHFPKDDYALRRFDGTALYEHEDPRLGEHPDWGTLIFNYGRNEVRNFLVANALYWLKEYHVDGLRVDAVASMLYLDYSRSGGAWTPNRYGGRENLEAIDFLRQFNEAVRIDAPGCITIAEESTAWPGVTKPVSDGGLGFAFKWNMGWMHDTIDFFTRDPIHRRHHHDQLTFAMMYEYTERFIMPLSHDEVVHLKGSLFSKMPGDEWQKFANLRLLLSYMFTRPGKKLLFMGTELASLNEWNHDASLDWHLIHTDWFRARHHEFMAALGHLYRNRPELWRSDLSWEGFNWIDLADRDNSVLSYTRNDGASHVVVVLNLTPVPREHYRVGVPGGEGIGRYATLLSSDDPAWGGSGLGFAATHTVEPHSFHGHAQSIVLTLPPLGATILAPERHP
jgi:1,4-alpha-glucan branching enzyme